MSTSPESNTNHSEVRPDSKRISSVWLIGTVAILGCSAWIFLKTRDNQTPLPSPADVRSLNASFYDREKDAKVAFEVPREHWDAIFSALQPAHRDSNPAKWAGMGELEFKLDNGKSYLVSLYSLADGELGAFSAGPTFEHRVYYRGGNSLALERALIAAAKSADVNPASASD